eukprot:1175753-Alexandrium_andersonii.AAC.1
MAYQPRGLQVQCQGKGEAQPRGRPADAEQVDVLTRSWGAQLALMRSIGVCRHSSRNLSADMG